MIDGHAHLNEIKEIDRALGHARAAGITGIVAVGMDLASNRDTLALAERFPGFVHPAIGYHPWSITKEGIEANLNFIRDHLVSCVALGEVGIDYGAKAKKQVQRDVFAQLLSVAASHQRPVIVHSRYSHQRTFVMVREAELEKAIFHWYSGPLEVLEQIVAGGYYVSCTPALAYSPPHQAAMKAAPLERILVETDSPVVYQGKESEPADLITTLRELSRVKECSFEEVARITSENAQRFFQI
jgi:TatD DNase family protein